MVSRLFIVLGVATLFGCGTFGTSVNQSAIKYVEPRGLLERYSAKDALTTRSNRDAHAFYHSPPFF